MTEQTYCDIKRFFKNTPETREYYRLLKDKLCTGMIFSNVPKCFLVPTGELLEDLKNTKSTEDLSNKVKQLILKTNVDLKDFNMHNHLVNINNKILDDVDGLLKNIVDRSKGSRFKPWMTSEKAKENKRGYNTVFIYNGKSLPKATKVSDITHDATEKRGKRSKKGGMMSSSCSEKYKQFVNLLNDVTRSKGINNIGELCKATLHKIFANLRYRAMNNSQYHAELHDMLLLFGYFNEDNDKNAVLSLLSIIKLIPDNELKHLFENKSLDDNQLSTAAESSDMDLTLINPSFKQNYNELIQINKSLTCNKEADFCLEYWSTIIKDAYQNLCNNFNNKSDIKFCWEDKLLVDELKCSFTNKTDMTVLEAFKWGLTTIMCNKNIIYYENISQIDLYKKELSESMEKFVNISGFFLYTSDKIIAVSGGSAHHTSMLLKSLEKQAHSLEKLISKIKSKSGGHYNNDNNSSPVNDTSIDNSTMSGGNYDTSDDTYGGSFSMGSFLGGNDTDEDDD